MKKEMIIDEYMDYTDARDFNDLLANWIDYDFEPASFNMPYAYIWLDEYGYDRLVIQKKDVMEFN
jgi:hypothetical protein